MKRIDVSDLPANAAAYELEDGRIFRVHLELKTPTDQLATAQDVEVETRGYQINAAGAFMVDDNLEPITLAPQRARIPLANVREGRDTMKPGWREVTEQPDPETPARKLKKLPATAEPGDVVLVDDKFYAYTEGLYESVRRHRLLELKAEAPTPVADQAFVDSIVL